MSGSNPPVWLPLAARVAARLMVGLEATWRIEHPDDYAALDREIQGGRRCIYALWHARLFPLILSHRGRGVAVVISRHRDGEWIARIAERLGYVTARGSSTRGGDAALRELMEFAGHGRSLAITPDGPRGPACRVKPGLVYLASRLGWPVVPVAGAANRDWTFRSWDRFRVPKPFARVRVAYGEPIVVPPDLDDAADAAWGDRIGAAIDAVTRAADEAVGNPA